MKKSSFLLLAELVLRSRANLSFFRALSNTFLSFFSLGRQNLIPYPEHINMWRKRTYNRRKHFLIDSNQKKRQKPKKLRNRTLNLLAKVLFFRQILKLFKTQFLLFLFIGSMAGFIAFALLSPYFEIKNITVDRDNPHIDVEAIEQVLKEIKGQNLILVSYDDIRDSLQEHFPEFRDIEISERWPNELILKINISPARFNIFNQETANFSVMSEDGVILPQEAQESLEVIKIFDLPRALKPGENFLEKDQVQKILNLQQLMNTQVKIPIAQRHFYPIAQELHLISQEGTAFWFDLRISPQSQIRKLELAANQIHLFTTKREHIDLRIPGQIFYQ